MKEEKRCKNNWNLFKYFFIDNDDDRFHVELSLSLDDDQLNQLNIFSHDIKSCYSNNNNNWW